MSLDEEYQSLQRRADDTRDSLMHTLDDLDRRRHELTDVRLQVRRHPAAAASLAGGLCALLGLVGFLVYRRARRERSLWRERGRALARAWQEPHRIASGKQGPFASELGRSVLLGIASFTLVELGKLGVRRLLARDG